MNSLLECVGILDHAKQFYEYVMSAANGNTGQDEKNINRLPR